MNDYLIDLTAVGPPGVESPSVWPPDAAGWVPDGRCVGYRPDGGRRIQITYNRGVAHGAYRNVSRDGTLLCEGRYVAGVLEGDWTHYFPDRVETLRFEAGKEVVDWDAVFGRKGPWSDPPAALPDGGRFVD